MVPELRGAFQWLRQSNLYNIKVFKTAPYPIHRGNWWDYNGYLSLELPERAAVEEKLGSNSSSVGKETTLYPEYVEQLLVHFLENFKTSELVWRRGLWVEKCIIDFIGSKRR